MERKESGQHPTTNHIGQTPAQQLAAAYLCVANCDHYMVGIVHTFDEDLWDEAEEILIDEQNALVEEMTDMPNDSPIVYNSTDAWAYGMLDLIGTFVARIEIDKNGLEVLKQLIPQYCGNTTYGRAVEAAIGQFIVAVKHANDQE